MPSQIRVRCVCWRAQSPAKSGNAWVCSVVPRLETCPFRERPCRVLYKRYHANNCRDLLRGGSPRHDAAHLLHIQQYAVRRRGAQARVCAARGGGCVSGSPARGPAPLVANFDRIVNLAPHKSCRRLPLAGSICAECQSPAHDATQSASRPLACAPLHALVSLHRRQHHWWRARMATMAFSPGPCRSGIIRNFRLTNPLS